MKYAVQNLDVEIDAKIQYLNTISDLSTFVRGNISTVLIKDSLRGGIFNYFSTGYTTDNGITFAANGGGFWVRYINTPNYYSKWWAIDTTGTTNVSTVLASIINNLPSGSNFYVSNGVFSLTSQLAINNSINILAENNSTKLAITGAFSLCVTFTGVKGVTVKGLEIYKTNNLTVNTLVFFDNSQDVTFTKNYVHDGGGGVTFRKSSNLEIFQNVITNTNLSGIRFSKNGNNLTDACFNVTIRDNYLENNDYSHTGGNGGIFLGSDGGTNGHSNFKIYQNKLYNQGAMCIACDGKGFDITVNDNFMVQSSTAEGVESMAWGGGSGTDGMKRLYIHNNYIEQTNPTKAGGGCILLYSNVTDVEILNNHTKGGPQGVMIHWFFDDSYIANVKISGNTFENTLQGVLFYKTGTNVLSNLPSNINIYFNVFDNVTTLDSYSTLTAAEQFWRTNYNYHNGKMIVRGQNNESIYSLSQSTFLGSFTAQGGLTTQYGGIYQVRPFNTGNPTNVLIGASAAINNPDQRFAGMSVQLSGISYNTTQVSLQASNTTVRKDVVTAKLDTGDVPILSLAGAWNNQLLKIGSFYIWDDGAGSMRRKATLPTSATDGTVF